MSVSIEEIRRLSTLARLKLSPEEELRHTETISAVLDYMKILNEVNTSGVEPTAQVTGLENVVRNDEVHPSIIRDELMAMMPQVENNELVVPEVFEDENNK